MPDVDMKGVSDYNGAFVSRAANQSISNNTVTTITFTAKSYDPLSLVDIAGAPTKITVKEGGFYIFSLGGEWAASTAERQISIAINGSGSNIQRALAAVGVTDQCLGGIGVQLAAGQYLEVLVIQFSGADLNISGVWLKAQRVNRIAAGT